jgi:hypothetical protein
MIPCGVPEVLSGHPLSPARTYLNALFHCFSPRERSSQNNLKQPMAGQSFAGWRSGEADGTFAATQATPMLFAPLYLYFKTGPRGTKRRCLGA